MAIPVVNTSACNIKDGMNDVSRGILGGILTAAAIGAAIHNADSAWRIAQKEWNLAKKYWRIANNWLNYYKDSFAPVEDQEIREARALTTEEPEYEVARGRAKAVAWAEFKGTIHKAMCATNKYCTGKRREILETLTTAQANALAMCDALGYRNERAYIEAKDDLRFQRQLETAKRGRNITANGPNFAANAAGIYGKLGDQAWEGLKGAGTFLGYMLNTQNPEYPTLKLTTVQPQQQQNTQKKG